MPFNNSTDRLRAAVSQLVASSEVGAEYRDKIKTLNTRLNSNGFDFRQDWEVMTDKDRSVFSADLFHSGESACGVEQYVQTGVDNHGKVEHEEDFRWHSPVLYKQVDDALSPSIGEQGTFMREHLDEIIGQVITTESDLVLEEARELTSLLEASQKVQAYEDKVTNALQVAGIQGAMSVAHADANGPDAQFIIDGEEYNLEVKLNTGAQMGDVAVRYYPQKNSVADRFEFSYDYYNRQPQNQEKLKKVAFDDVTRKIVLAALSKKEDDILAWVKALKDPARPASSNWERNEDAQALFKTTFRRYQEAKVSGLLNKAGAGFHGKPAIKVASSTIGSLYASKDIYYIQVGGRGLYYLSENPANLPIPQFTADLAIQLRARPGGGKKEKEEVADEETGELVKTTKFERDPDTGEYLLDDKGKQIPVYVYHDDVTGEGDRVRHYGGSYSVTLRFIDGLDADGNPKLKDTSYSLDDPDSIKRMLSATNNVPESLSRDLKKKTITEEESNITSEPSKAERLVLSLPKFRPSEAWGDPASIDRQNVEALFGTVQGNTSKDIQKKLNSLMEVASTDPNRISSTRRILGNIILLETLASVIQDFSASAGGFVFEAFCAALFGGRQVQDTEGGSLPIEDIVAFTEWGGEVPVSLKALKDQGNIHGSFTNLITALDRWESGITYLIAYKAGDYVTFDLFKITRKSVLDILFSAENKSIAAKYSSRGQKFRGINYANQASQVTKYLREQEKLGWEALSAALRQTKSHAAQKDSDEVQERLAYNVQDHKRLLAEAKTKKGDGGLQWTLTAKNMKNVAGIGHLELGKLPIERGLIVKVAEKYMEHLSDNLTTIFESVASLSENVNSYFTYADRSEAIESGSRAIKNTATVASELQRDISSGGDPGSS